MATWAELVALYRLTMDAPPHNLRPRYNVCPTDPVDVVTAHNGKRELMPMRWGLVPWWWSKPLKELRMATFNARAETVETKPVFRDAFKRSRCLIPISGYFEWQAIPSGKQPWYFTAADGSPLLTVAGLWDEWKNRETGERLKSCTMIVGEPNEFAADITIERRSSSAGAIRAVAQRGSGSGVSETSAERLLATLARIKAGQ